MARTNAVINGTDLGVYTGTVTPTIIGLATSCTLTLNTDMRDTSNKGSAGFKAVLPGQKNWTISTEGLYNPSTTNSFITLYSAWLAGTALTLTWKNSTQDYYWSGTAYITSLSQNAPLEGNVTWSVSFQGTGAIVMTDPLT
jgi:predicted secreted protein